MKPVLLALFLTLFSITVFADQTMRPDGRGGWIINNDTGPCAGLTGPTAASCAGQQLNMQRLRNQQQLQIQQQQQQLQQQLQEQQIENQRLQNEILRMKLEQEQQAKKS